MSIGDDWRPALLGHFHRILLSFICVHLRSSADDCIVLIIRTDRSSLPPRPETCFKATKTILSADDAD